MFELKLAFFIDFLDHKTINLLQIKNPLTVLKNVTNKIKQ